MLVSNIIKVVLLLLGGVFIVLEGMGFNFEGSAISTVMLMTLVILYWIWTKRKSKFFLLFVSTFAIAEIIGFCAYFGPEYQTGEIDHFYFSSNMLFILAYIFLIHKVLRRLNLRVILSQFYVPIVILLLLDVFCVTLVTATTENVLSIYEYSLEFIYNAVIMALLSVALINYMYRNDNKSMLFLLGSICIVFSEIIQLAYYYVVINDSYLRYIYSIFLVSAFTFFYLQSQLKYTGPEPAFSDGHLKM